MPDLNEKYRATMLAVATDRERGDALNKVGRSADAVKLWERGIHRLDELRTESNGGQLLSHADHAELLGVAAGLYRRCGNLEKALESYMSGAEVESAGDLASTYNRVNAVKLSLLRGQRTVAAISDQLLGTEAALYRRLQTDSAAAGDAWQWADLGDLRLLLGNEPGALQAYGTFKQKATTGSPRRTLTMLEQLSEALIANNDPSASRVAKSVDRAKGLLR